VGVVRDARLGAPNEGVIPTLFPLMQSVFATSPTFLVRCKGNPAHLVPSIRAAFASVDSRFNAGAITIRQTYDGVFEEEQKTLNLLLEMAVISMALTIIGVFGLISYMVKQRTREIGIRIAVGAEKAHIMALVYKFALWMTVAGVALGIPLAIGCAFLLRHLVQGINPIDLPTFCCAALAVAVLALAASLGPALRAIRIEPMTALRSE
jgi:ABC-type antimicrobial peptide transport system permease subunit